MLAYDTVIDAVAAIDALGFDVPFTIDAHGIVARAEDHPDIYPPTVTHHDDDDIEIDGSDDWQAMAGLTGQYGYDGAVLHPSEVMSTGVVRAMAEDQDTERWVFVLVVVVTDTCDDCPPFNACDNDHPPAGWTILHMPHPVRQMTDWEAEEAFEEAMDDIYGTCEIAGITFDTGRAFRILDPIAFRCGVADWADANDVEII